MHNSGPTANTGIAVKPAMPTLTYNSSMPSEHEMAVFNTVARQAVESKLYRGIGEVSGVMMIMLSARELGIPPMSALNGGLNIINGKVEISARMMNALIRKAGHSISITESTHSSCTLSGKRGDNNDTATVSYTLEEATKAGLVKPGGGWTKNPKDMCFARAMSRLARQLFSDVIGIGYVEGEIAPKEIEITETHEDETTLLQRYYGIFDEAEIKTGLPAMYISEVMKHFSWSKSKTLTEFLKDTTQTYARYRTWRTKQDTNPEKSS